MNNSDSEHPNIEFRNKRLSSWTWYSTRDSILKRQISILSILETILAFGLYIWLIFYTEHKWLLIVSTLTIPVILLRSPTSINKGVKWLNDYWDLKDVTNQFKGKSGKAIIIKVFLLSLIISFPIYVMSLELSLNYQFINILILTILVIGAARNKLSLSVTIVGVLPLTVLIAFGFALVKLYEMCFDLIEPFIKDKTRITNELNQDMDEHFELIMRIILVLVIAPIGALTLWMRTLFIRIIATLRHPIVGLYHRQLKIRFSYFDNPKIIGHQCA